MYLVADEGLLDVEEVLVMEVELEELALCERLLEAEEFVMGLEGVEVDGLAMAVEYDVRGLSREQGKEVPVVQEQVGEVSELVGHAPFPVQEQEQGLLLSVPVDQMDGEFARADFMDDQAPDRELLFHGMARGHHHSPFDV